MKKIIPFPRRTAKSKSNKADPAGPPTDEEIILAAYLQGLPEQAPGVVEACDRLEVPDDLRCSRLDAAVGQVLIQWVQGTLPQWATRRDGVWIEGRAYRAPSKGNKVNIVPRLLFEINWASTAPGLSWPESYHLAYVPGHHRYVVIASQDGTDTWGCTDQAMGHFAPRERPLVGARRILTTTWRQAFESYGQGPWEEVLRGGMVDEARAWRWRRAVWPDDYET